MNVAFSIVLLFILLDCVANEKPPCAKGCHVPLTAFYRPIKALLAQGLEYLLNSHLRFVTINHTFSVAEFHALFNSS